MTYGCYQVWKQWTAAGFGSCDRSESAYFAAEMRRSGVPLRHGMRIVEIGFGNGAFAGWAVRNGADYRGVEIMPELVQRGREKGFDVFDKDVPLSTVASDSSVDVVVAFDVMEHLDLAELTSLLRTAYPALKVGGRLVARVPSGDSPFARAIQHGDLTHRSTLGSSAVRQLAGATGFKVVQLRAPVLPLTGDGSVALVRRGLVTLGRALIYPVIVRLLMGGGSPVLSPNMLFVLERPGDAE